MRFTTRVKDGGTSAMYRELDVAVVVPAHPGDRLIGTVISTMPEFVDRIVVVDDASTAGTSAAATAQADARVDVITLEENLGVGGAIMAGHRHVLAGDADVA